MFKNKKGQMALFIAIALAVVGLLLVGVLAGSRIQLFVSSWRLGSFVGYEPVYKLNWGHMECVQNQDYDITKVYTTLSSGGQFVRCDHFTNECDVSVLCKAGTFGGFNRHCEYYMKTCNLDGGGCTSESYQTTRNGVSFTYSRLPVGKQYFFRPYSSDEKNRALEITKKAKSFYIRGVEDGKIYVQESCVLNAALRGKVLVDGLAQLEKVGANRQQNYVIGFNLAASQIYTDGSRQVICQSRQLYGITQKKFLDGATYKVQGDLIRSVECCPGEPNCNADSFRFVENNVRECTFNAECPNGGNPIAVSGHEYVTYGCQANKCVKSASQTVECTNTQACVDRYGDKSVCDLSTLNFGKCKTSTTPDYCGDGTCRTLGGETAQTCAADCFVDESTIPWWAYALGIVCLVLALIVGYPYLKRIPYVGSWLP